MDNNKNQTLKISLDFEHVIAGDSVVGGIILNSTETQCKLTLTALGIEKVKIITTNADVKSHESQIFSITTDITNSTVSLQEIYPFSLKLPMFIPASFLFDEKLVNGDKVKAEIIYKIIITLSKNSTELAKTSKRYTVFSRKSLDRSENQSEIVMPLRSCRCIPRGATTLLIQARNSVNSIGNDLLRFDIILNSASNSHLESVIGQLIFDLSIKIPGEKTINFKKILSRRVPDIQNLKNSQSDTNELLIDFELNLLPEEISGNICSNEAVIIKSQFQLQVFAVYNIGWRSKMVEGQLKFHINPIAARNKKINNNWDIEPMQLFKIEAPTNNMHLYST